MMLFRVGWVCVTVVLMFFSMYFSTKLNVTKEWKWFFVSWIFSCCTPIWTIIAKYSNDIIFDAALFDITIFVSCVMFLLILNRDLASVKPLEIVGILVMFIGLFLFKYKDIF